MCECVCVGWGGGGRKGERWMESCYGLHGFFICNLKNFVKLGSFLNSSGHLTTTNTQRVPAAGTSQAQVSSLEMAFYLSGNEPKA